MTKIENCTIWTNGMVSCFDKSGEQIPEYQGFILDVAEKLKTGCDENTKWSLGKFGELLLDANLGWYWEKKKEQKGEE